MITNKKIGILGGGQLGKMLCEAASPMHLNLSVLDQDENMSAADYCTSFTKGSFKDFEDVLAFGKSKDIVTIEIEHVNLDALEQLEKMGVEVHPCTSALRTIVDKGLQKSFYRDHNIPTSPFTLYESKEQILKAINEGRIKIPFVQKTRTEGYDGRGVQLIKSADQTGRIVDVPSVIEELVDIDKELAVITAQNPDGQIESFDPVDMKFKDGANLLDVLECPADIPGHISSQLIQISEKIIKELEIIGVLAIEFFLDVDGNIFVNEVAPRPHNSGHHTIENNIVSQYEQHLRAILNLPLIKPQMILPSVMINILGEDGYSGEPEIEGVDQVLKIQGAYMHWYGKRTTKPFRKMGHITFLNESKVKSLETARKVRSYLKIKSK